MKIALYDDWRLGLVSADGSRITDVTSAVDGHDGDPFAAGWWQRVCRDWQTISARITDIAAHTASSKPVANVQLRASALNPGKVIAAAGNYPRHSAEMVAIVERTTPDPTKRQAKGRDVFLKAPSSIIGPGGTIVLPTEMVAAGSEIHHEAELVVVIGRRGSNIAVADAMGHVLGYTIGIDVTVRGAGDRSRRKSYDTFTPLGPWMTTADEVPNPHELRVTLEIDGEIRQDVSTDEMDVSIAELVSFASRSMTLEPGDLIFTGAPPGVGPLSDGDQLTVSIEGLGSMNLSVRTGD